MQIEFPSNILKGTFSVKKNKDGKYIKGKIQRIHLQIMKLFKYHYLQISKYSMLIVMIMI